MAQGSVDWRDTPDGPAPYLGKERLVWAPQPGSQLAFMECPVFEALIEGPRGTGKTEVLIFDFAQFTGRGFGAEWRGILFRQTYLQLADVIQKTKKWFPKAFPRASFNESKNVWTWSTGETLRLAYMERESDYWNYHGWEIPWIGWEELTTWPDDSLYKRMMSCCRSSSQLLGSVPTPDGKGTIKNRMPRRFRATTNPYGVGHNWVKARFRLPVSPGERHGPMITEPDGDSRVVIHSTLQENQMLMRAEPGYIARVGASARNEAQRKAWVEGSWDIVAGGMFDDLWSPAVHVLPDLDFKQIPRGWRLNRSFDHGQSKPSAVLWWAESNGEPMQVGGRQIGLVPRDLILIAEWYTWTGSPNEGQRLLATQIAEGIVEREKLWGIRQRVRPGPADLSIFVDTEPSKSVAGDMIKRGIRWERADKRDRVQGWLQVRKWLSGAHLVGEKRETPGLFICRRCEQTTRTFPVLPRDEKNLDDVDTDAEDHIGDAIRYRVREQNRRAGIVEW